MSITETPIGFLYMPDPGDQELLPMPIHFGWGSGGEGYWLTTIGGIKFMLSLLPDIVQLEGDPKIWMKTVEVDNGHKLATYFPASRYVTVFNKILNGLG